MLLRLQDVECVPYAVDHWTFAGLKPVSFSGRGLLLESPFPVAVIASPTLRLHALRYDFSGIRDVSPETPAGDLARRYLQSLCSPWDRTTRTFLDHYFKDLAERLTVTDPEFDARIARFSGLYRKGDWLASAPAPLPRAHLFAPLSGPEKAASEQDFVVVDLAFRVGGRFVALMSDAAATSPRVMREKRARLEAQGVRILDLQSGASDADLRRLVTHILGADEAAFWKADALPRGLSPPAGLLP